MPLTEDDDMVEAIAPHRADEPFHEGILPRTLGRREDFIDAHAVLRQNSVRSASG